MKPDKILEKIKFDDKGLIPAIIQDEVSGEVLTLCYMNLDGDGINTLADTERIIDKEYGGFPPIYGVEDLADPCLTCIGHIYLDIITSVIRCICCYRDIEVFTCALDIKHCV